jgi:hypothetical protein
MIMLYPHFVFGYGSLICPDSRAITAPTVADRAAPPATVLNVERTWAKQSKRLSATSMGVRFRDGADCVGVLVPVNDAELEQFDEREIGYDRFELNAAEVLPVPFLDEDDYYKNTFLEDDSTLRPPRIWIYVQQSPVPATVNYPIAQSYVDIILRGCLTISEEFATEFIQTTKGWDPSELMEDDSTTDSEEGNNSDNDDMDEGWWVDDRRDPLYSRADKQYSLKNAKKLDALLALNRPEEFGGRVRKGRIQVRSHYEY